MYLVRTVLTTEQLLSGCIALQSVYYSMYSTHSMPKAEQYNHSIVALPVACILVRTEQLIGGCIALPSGKSVYCMYSTNTPSSRLLYG